MKNFKFTIAAILILAIGISAGYFFRNNSGSSNNTQTGNNQNNSGSNDTTTPPAGMKTYSDGASGVSYWYPEEIGTKYISKVDWPPAVQVMAGPFSCTQAGDVNATAGKTELKIISGRNYCVTIESEGAAGSIYNQYAYSFSKNDKNIILTFSLRFVQCANYDTAQANECTTERNNFSVDSIVDQIAQSAKL